MKSFDEHAKKSKKVRPFTSSADWVEFSESVCMGAGRTGRGCVHWSPTPTPTPCPLIELSEMGRKPAEWATRFGSYSCSEHTTVAEAKRAEKAESQAARDDMHYSMFEEES